MPIDKSLLRALWPWLVEAKYAWLSFGVIVLALLVSVRPGASEPMIRLTGLLLQLLGIGTVIWGIAETRVIFGHPSFFAKATKWLSRFPLRKRNYVLAAGAAVLASDGAVARGYATHGPGQNPSLDNRVEALEQNQKVIHRRIDEAQKEMDAGFRKSADAVRIETEARKTEDQSIRQQLEATGTGGVHISAIGASWLFVGVILSSASNEIAQCLK